MMRTLLLALIGPHNYRNLPHYNSMGLLQAGERNQRLENRANKNRYHNMHPWVGLLRFHNFERTLRPVGKRGGRAGNFSWPGKVNSKYNAPVPSQQDNPVFLLYVGTVLGRL